MIDIEKVKKGLLCCQVDEDDDLEQCGKCPYNEISLVVQECRSQLSRDAYEIICKMQQS